MTELNFQLYLKYRDTNRIEISTHFSSEGVWWGIIGLYLDVDKENFIVLHHTPSYWSDAIEAEKSIKQYLKELETLYEEKNELLSQNNNFYHDHPSYAAYLRSQKKDEEEK